MGSRILAGRYELLEKIGEGGMAVVFKARDRLLSRFVAIKILRPEYTKDMMFIESFRRESQIAAGLVHPNIVNVYDVGKEGNIYYIVMELIEGRPLSEIIKEEGALDPYKAADIAKQVASALSMAHKHQLIHRDVKPHNIMITADGIAKITDFGIAKAVNNETLVGEQKEAVMGSVHYFSPEQARGAYVDEKSDIYSLGIVLYEMLTGKVPFDGETAVAVAVKHMNEEMVPPSKLNPDIPQDLEDIVMKATNKLQTGRYRNADEMITALNFVKFSRRSQSSAEAPAVTRSGRSDAAAGESREDGSDGEEKPRRRFNWAWVALILAALALAVPASGLVKNFLNDSQPAEQTEIKPGDKLEAPNIVGKSLEDAIAQLEAQGLKIEVDLELQSSDYAAGTILSQTPDAGASIKSGQTIKVNISKGVVNGEIPSVIGKSVSNARTTIETYHFTVGTITQEISETVPRGSVISQSPVAGTPMEPGSVVNLVVSQGSQQEVSLSQFNVEGMSLDEAKKTIEELGLVLGEVTPLENADLEEDTVISQSPTPGMPLNEGDTIDLVVSKEPVVVEDPDPSQGEEPGIAAGVVSIWIDYSPAVNDELIMTVTVSDAEGAYTP
ncbi:MAG: Stk1 family PASTA domain-containing Ser/Thr kinase, partial [Clostridia bacterium]|nr:Stk1 family PASTA domain-containing Ser/Thr kinase [Clostridia bacterium]